MRWIVCRTSAISSGSRRRHRIMLPPAANYSLTRRAFLGRYAGCLGSLALTQLLHDEARAAGGPLSTRAPHLAPKAKAVICLFQHGGPSQMGLFGYKTELK